MRHCKHVGYVALLLLILISFSLSQAAWGKVRDAEKLIDEGTNSLVSFDFVNAYITFAAALEQLTPTDARWVRAAYGKAVAAQHRTPPTPEWINEAVQLYEQIAGKDRNDAFAARGRISLGRIAELRDYAGDEVDLAGARAHYVEAIDRWPDSETADEAALWLAGTFIQDTADLDAVRRGVAMLEEWLKRRPDNAYAATMHIYLAETYFQTLKNDRRVIECYLNADRLGIPGRSNAGVIYWRLAAIAERTDEIDIAIRYYQKIVIVTPTSGRAYESQMALKRLAARYPDRTIEIPTIEIFYSPTETSAANP